MTAHVSRAMRAAVRRRWRWRDWLMLLYTDAGFPLFEWGVFGHPDWRYLGAFNIIWLAFVGGKMVER